MDGTEVPTTSCLVKEKTTSSESFGGFSAIPVPVIVSGSGRLCCLSFKVLFEKHLLLQWSAWLAATSSKQGFLRWTSKVVQTIKGIFKSFLMVPSNLPSNVSSVLCSRECSSEVQVCRHLCRPPWCKLSAPCHKPKSLYRSHRSCSTCDDEGFVLRICGTHGGSRSLMFDQVFFFSHHAASIRFG